MPRSSRPKLLILDATTVIELHELGLWDLFLKRYEVHLSRIVAEEEVRFFHGEEVDQQIDLSSYAEGGQITVFDVTASDLSELRDRFDVIYAEKLDDGETESLVYLLHHPEFRICSADKIVFKVVGRLGLSDAGVSLEELLQQSGLSRKLSHEHCREYRLIWTKVGIKDGIYDL
jgi:hypothetical protein